MKKCPFCAEEIQDEAIVCKHCGRELAPQKVAQISETLIDAEVISDEPTPESAMHVDDPHKRGNGLIVEQQKKKKKKKTKAPTEDAKPQRPIWKSALLGGFVLSLVVFCYLVTEYYRRGFWSDELSGHLTVGIPSIFVIGTLLGFILVPLWRWKKWAPFVLAALMIAGVWGYQSGIVNLQLPNFASQLLSQDSLSNIESTSVPKSTTVRAPTTDTKLSEFVAYWEHLVGFSTRLDKIADDYSNGKIHEGIANWENLRLRLDMNGYDHPPSVAQFHDRYKNIVSGLIMLNEALDNSNLSLSDRYERATRELRVFWYDINDYAESLGYDIWTRYCEKNPSETHQRCRK